MLRELYMYIAKHIHEQAAIRRVALFENTSNKEIPLIEEFNLLPMEWQTNPPEFIPTYILHGMLMHMRGIHKDECTINCVRPVSHIVNIRGPLYICMIHWADHLCCNHYRHPVLHTTCSDMVCAFSGKVHYKYF